MNSYYPKKGRVIFHVDMNSFYASVEMAYDPTLKGKPLAIAGNPEERKGIIVTCSYEARKFGVKTTMPLWEAKKLCSHLIIMRPNFDRYRAASKGMFDILRQYADLVEPVSIDEGYMDISGAADLGTPVEIAQSIQNQIERELDLPCSIGIAPNKFLAKTASDMKKPMGITILRIRDIPQILWPRDVVEMHGIGEKTAQKLYAIGVKTINDLAHGEDLLLKSTLGINGIRLKKRANGEDPRPVDPDSIYDFKSIGNSTTLPKDSTNQKELLNVIHTLSSKVASRLKNKGMMATTIQVMIRFKNRKTITRSKKVRNPVQLDQTIFEEAKQLFLKHWNGDSVRLLGVTGQDLIEKDEAVEQLDLFSYEKAAEKEPLYDAISRLQKKYGKKMIKKGIEHNEHKQRDNQHDTSFNKDFLRED
ncbi:DNA polymerase IV [Rossellomorea sp. BNER]|uniref:DNA polymerase IV n=1 Tax=Rossellomorea sp. BNER TaxID=2962031 RepID=UPI003AF1FE3B|nr:DNA polymerase IV [Rossellomorea sp. BNER]